VYHTLFFIIPALQSENYNKKSKLKYFFLSNLCRLIVGQLLLFRCFAIINCLFIIVQNVGEFVVI
jgi:hypothetical protein